MNVIDAAYRTVHSYPGGSESLATRIGTSPAVLNSKVNPNTKTHRLALDEADELMGLTGDFQILQALASRHGFGLVRLDMTEQGGNDPHAIASGILAVNACGGELARVIHDALADGVITEREMRDISALGAANQRALITLITLLRDRAGKPLGRAA